MARAHMSSGYGTSEKDISFKKWTNLSSPLNLITMNSTLVKIFPRDGKYLFIIQIQDEIKEFMNYTESSVYSSEYPYVNITQPSKEGVLFIWSQNNLLPIIFDSNKKPIEIKSFPFICHAKVKINFASWNRVNDTIRLHYQMEQILLDTSYACAWN